MDLEQLIEQFNEELGENTITTASNINRPREPKIIVPNLYEEFTLRNPEFTFRNPKAGGGMLVKPSADGRRPGYKEDKKIRVYDSPDVDKFSDALLDAYAKDDITKIVESGKSTKFSNVITAIESGKDKSAKLAKVIKNTGLDEETIFDLLDDRKAYIDLAREGGPAGSNPRAGDFYKKAENWIIKNSKRYADPDKFKKAFIRTFGTNNDLTKTMKRLNVPGARKQTSVPFSPWFKETILGSTKGSSAGYNFNQLNNIFKTSIYTNNENVRNKLTKEINRILSIPLEKGGKFDIRNEIKNSPLFKKFGFDKQIRGPIARLLANEVGQELLDQISSFRDPYLGTTELIRFLKNNVDPKYKSMFEEAAKAADLATKNKWPEAKKILKIKDDIMFDHKIPKQLVNLGYADELEYIKLNPTSAEFNTRIKNPQFDQKIIKLVKDFEKAKTLDAKANVVTKMNKLKNDFSKKYGGYLDEISINVDKTGKPIFTSAASPITKKTDFVSSLGKSLTQTGEINKKQYANLLNAFCESGRIKQASGTNPDGLTCSMEEIQRGIQRETDKARKVSIDGRIPKKFGKLRALAGSLFGSLDIPLEFMFAAPYLAVGDVEGAKRQTIFGGYGFPDRDISKMSKEAQRYIKHLRATEDWMKNYFIVEEKKQELKNLKPNTGAFELATNQLNRANENMAKIANDYGKFGYSFVGKDTPLQGKVNLQKQLRAETAQEFQKAVEKPATTLFFKDSDPEKLDSSIRELLGGDLKYRTPIKDLESHMANKGEPMAGNENLIFNVQPLLFNRATDYGQPELFDDYALGAGVEAPGRKSLQDAYSEIPLEYANQLAALEKKQLEEGLLKRQLDLGTGFAGGGIAGLSGGIDEGPQRRSMNPDSQGLSYLFNRVKKV